jgi:hypothetical protein
MNKDQMISGYEFRVEYGVIAEKSGFSDPLNTFKILVDILLPHLHSVDVYLLELIINI